MYLLAENIRTTALVLVINLEDLAMNQDSCGWLG